jgi:hypothetical protein
MAATFSYISCTEHVLHLRFCEVGGGISDPWWQRFMGNLQALVLGRESDGITHVVILLLRAPYLGIKVDQNLKLQILTVRVGSLKLRKLDSKQSLQIPKRKF